MTGPKLVKLHDKLYVRSHTKGVLSDSMLHTLQAHGIQLVMNVALINDPFLANAARLVGIQYRHEPMSDSKNIDVDRVRKLAAEVAEAMKHYGVLVHCDSGWNRSNLVAILALSKFTGRPTHELIAEARVGRPKVLKNKHFEEFVLSH